LERKVFSVEEANRAIPRLARLMKLLQERYRWLRGHGQEIEYLVAEYNIINEGPVDPEYFQVLSSVRTALGEVNELGAQVKDIKTGLVDFPSRIKGREVLLCWRLGESRGGYWHDPEAGFAGRQPLSEIPGDTEPEEGN